MGQIFTTHQGAPVAVSSPNHQLLKPIMPDSTPKLAVPPNAGEQRRINKAKRKASAAERARELRHKARTFATGVK